MHLLGVVILGVLSGLLGMLAGWFGLAMAVIGIVGSDREGGVAIGAFFNIGPIGGVAGFALGVWVFRKFGLSRPHIGASAPSPARIARPFAAMVLLITAGLGWWGWWELIRSPYLSHGSMNLALQFRLPDGMPLPGAVQDIALEVTEGGNRLALISIREHAWHGHDGNHSVILASATLMYKAGIFKAGRRTVSLTLPGHPAETWTLDLANDPDPMKDFSPWRPSDQASNTGIEMNYLLDGK